MPVDRTSPSGKRTDGARSTAARGASETSQRARTETEPRARTETAIVADILRTLGVLPWLRVWRQNTGAVKYGDRLVRFGVPGQADIQGVMRGAALFIEAKRPGQRQTEQQRHFQAMVETFGHVYIVATSGADALEQLEARR
jgi:hypothetical protein